MSKKLILIAATIGCLGLSKLGCDFYQKTERMYLNNSGLREMNFSNSAKDDRSKALVEEVRDAIAYSNISCLGGGALGIYAASLGSTIILRRYSCNKENDVQ